MAKLTKYTNQQRGEALASTRATRNLPGCIAGALSEEKTRQIVEDAEISAG